MALLNFFRLFLSKYLLAILINFSLTLNINDTSKIYKGICTNNIQIVKHNIVNNIFPSFALSATIAQKVGSDIAQNSKIKPVSGILLFANFINFDFF